MKPKKPLHLESSEYVHQGFFDLRIDTLKKNGGATLSYTVLSTKADAVSIVALDEKKNLILNKEYRHPIGKYVLSSPGGRIEKGEDPAIAAQRELLEETGYFAEKVIFLGHFYPMPSICDQKIYLYYAPLAKLKKKQNLDPFEFIETVFISEKELFQEIKKGLEIDGSLATALLYKNL